MRAVGLRSFNQCLALEPESILKNEIKAMNYECEALLTEAVTNLPEKERHLVLMRSAFHCRFEEIAVSEHMSTKAVRRKYSHIVEKVKAMIIRGFALQYYITNHKVLWKIN